MDRVAFLVCEFSDGVATVSSNWFSLDRQTVHWPPEREYSKHIKNKSIPTDNWEVHEVLRIFYETWPSEKCSISEEGLYYENPPETPTQDNETFDDILEETLTHTTRDHLDEIVQNYKKILQYVVTITEQNKEILKVLRQLEANYREPIFPITLPLTCAEDLKILEEFINDENYAILRGCLNCRYGQ